MRSDIVLRAVGNNASSLIEDIDNNTLGVGLIMKGGFTYHLFGFPGEFQHPNARNCPIQLRDLDVAGVLQGKKWTYQIFQSIRSCIFDCKV